MHSFMRMPLIACVMEEQWQAGGQGGGNRSGPRRYYPTALWCGRGGIGDWDEHWNGYHIGQVWGLADHTQMLSAAVYREMADIKHLSLSIRAGSYGGNTEWVMATRTARASELSRTVQSPLHTRTRRAERQMLILSARSLQYSEVT